MTERSPREASTRDKATRKRTWKPPALLPDPPKSDEYRYKWVRVSTMGESDPTNASRKLREGWEFVPMDDPIVQHLDVYKNASASNVEVGGLALARMPEEMARQREDYYTGAARAQVESLDRDYMRENDPRMPLLKPQRETKID